MKSKKRKQGVEENKLHSCPTWSDQIETGLSIDLNVVLTVCARKIITKTNLKKKNKIKRKNIC